MLCSCIFEPSCCHAQERWDQRSPIVLPFPTNQHSDAIPRHALPWRRPPASRRTGGRANRLHSSKRSSVGRAHQRCSGVRGIKLDQARARHLNCVGVGPQIPVAVFMNIMNIHCNIDIVKIISVKLGFLSHEIIIQQHRRMCIINSPNSNRSRNNICTIR